MRQDFGAIVIGTGFGGAVTACRLTEAGWDICVLERGRRYGASDLPVLRDEGARHGPQEGTAERELPDFTRSFWKLGQGLWDLRHLGDLVVGQAAGYGGGSLIYANVHLRAPDEVFESWPDPYTPGALQKHYDLAAYMLDVQPIPDELPKTTRLESLATSEALHSRFRAFRPPLAINFGEARANRYGAKQGACDMRGECCFGCHKQAKNSLDLNYLAAAEQRGAEVRTLAEVVSIERVQQEPCLYEVRYRDHLQRGCIGVVWAPYVFLCAGAVNTTELLLRSREAGHLEIEGSGLGTRYYPNVDDLGVVFDCDEEHELDRGPTITSSLLYEDSESWLLIQDGGMPTPLEPLLGVFRSPLWLGRNGFAKKPGAADPKTGSDVASQRLPYAELPVASLLDALSGLTGSAIGSQLALAHEVSHSLLAFARGGRDLEHLLDADAEAREWKAYPDQLGEAATRIHESFLANLALASGPVVDSFLRSTAAAIPDGLLSALRGGRASTDFAGVSEGELREWVFRLGVQIIWGSQAGLIGSIAKQLSELLVPEAEEALRRAGDLLRWAADYRVGDGHTALLLSFGRDSAPARLDLASSAPPPGSRITGKSSQASGVLVSRSQQVVVIADASGPFQAGEWVLAGPNPLGVCRTGRLEELKLGAPSRPLRRAAESASLRALFVDPLPDAEDLRRFRTDCYREGEWKSSRRTPEPDAPLRARLPQLHETPERSVQELLLRDVAEEFGGELRTDPLWAFLGCRLTVHSQGGCAMGAGPQEGVTAPSGEVFGCPGLFVMDAAAFPSSVGVNPSATIAAVAEHKIEHFLRRPEHDPGWTPREMEDAEAWARPRRSQLDPIRTLKEEFPGPSAAPEHEPIGIEFTEVMKGSHRPWPDGSDGPECEIETVLTATIEDLAVFLAQDREGKAPTASVGGDVRIAWPDRDAGVYVVKADESRLGILVDREGGGGERRSIDYKLVFDVDGRAHVLDGVKDIRDDAACDVWEDTTTLRFQLKRQSDDQVFRWGVLRLPASEFFGGQLRSFKATHTDDPARQLWALAAFGRFFFGHLVDVYVPALDRVGDVLKGIARRDHV